MDINQLIQLVNNRLSFLETQRGIAFNEGDAETLSRIEAQIAENTATLNKLNSLN